MRFWRYIKLTYNIFLEGEVKTDLKTYFFRFFKEKGRGGEGEQICGSG